MRINTLQGADSRTSGKSWFPICAYLHGIQLYWPMGVSFNELFITLPSFSGLFPISDP